MGVSFVLRLIKPYSDVMGTTVFLMLLSALAGLALPMLGGSVAEGVLTDAGANVGSLLLSILIIFLAQAVLKYISEVMSARTSTRLHADLRGRVYDHVQALPLEFHLAREKGDIIALLSSEVNHLAHFVTSTIVTLTPLLVTFCGAAFFMIQIDMVLGSVIVVLIPVFFIMMRVLSGRLKPIGAELREAQAKLLSILQENMGLIPAIKTFNREPIESERYRAQADKIKELDFALRRSGAKLQPAVQLAAGIAVVAVLWFASQGMQQGTMSPAELITFLLFAALIIRPMNQLAGFWGEFQAARGAAERLSVLDTTVARIVDAQGRLRPVPARDLAPGVIVAVAP
ncbi:MAG: ABC transporter transmembrane domain-containing protein, partial [Alphaproteobacteria bacterium]|nr:ABC transporter transmembrane domain-containing protein [Alphaproteobacteria bacterium]